MAPEAYLLIRMVEKDTNSKSKSLEAVKKIRGVKKACLTYGPRDINCIAEVKYGKHIPDLVNIIEKIGKLENVWIHEVHRTEQNITEQNIKI